MTIYISGDTHGIWDVNKIQELNATKDDYIIICGDCGVLWDKKSAPKMIELYESFGATVLFVDGTKTLICSRRCRSWRFLAGARTK